MNNIYFDTETSGLRPGQIGQLAVIIEGTDGIKAKNYYLDMKSIEPGAAEVTGRNLEFYHKASGGKIFKDYADEIENIFNGNRIIAHNVQFDEAFLSMELFRVGKNFHIGQRFDTMTFFQPIMKLPSKNSKDLYKKPKLIELIQYLKINENEVAKYTSELFNIDSNSFHDAMYDTTSMYIACKVWNDTQSGTKQFIDRFIIK